MVDSKNKFFKGLFIVQILLTLIYGYLLVSLGNEGNIFFEDIPTWIHSVGIIYFVSSLLLILMVFFSKGLHFVRKNKFTTGLIYACIGIIVYASFMDVMLTMPLFFYGVSLVALVGIITAFVILMKNKDIKDIYECEKCGKEFDSEEKAERHEKQCRK